MVTFAEIVKKDDYTEILDCVQKWTMNQKNKDENSDNVSQFMKVQTANN